MTLAEQLRRDEGVRLHPYQDTEDVWTWGVGHNLSQPLCHDVVELLCQGELDAACALCLGEDIANVRGQLVDILPWYLALSDARRGVLENMAFNLGVQGLLGFRRMLAHTLDGAWEDAATAMLDSRWARQVGARAVRLADQMRTDVWQ